MTSITGVRIEIVEWESVSFDTIDARGTVGPHSRQGLLRIDTTDGVVGECFFGATAIDLEVAVAQISRVLGPSVMGRSIDEALTIGGDLGRMTGHGTSLRPGWAPIDIALWDISGKLADAPIVELLGRLRQRIPVYATHPPTFGHPRDLLAELEPMLADGLRAYKLHPGPLPPEKVAEFARQLRSIDTDLDLMLDPNNSYTRADALAVGHALDTARFRWFEDPMAVDDIEGALSLAGAISTPVAISDSVWFGLSQMGFFVDRGFRTLRASSRWAGITGLTEACTLMASTGGTCEIGLGGNPSMNAANLHVMGSVDNSTYYEHWLPAERHQFGVLNPSSPTAGWIAVPSGQGLGVTIDEAWVAAHRVASL